MLLRKDAKNDPRYSQSLRLSVKSSKKTLPPYEKTIKVKPKTPLNLELVVNDGTREAWKKLLDFKNIITRQLIKMERTYITKLVFDGRHESLIASIPQGKTIGGACFRCF
jgi:hypothetical protein